MISQLFTFEEISHESGKTGASVANGQGFGTLLYMKLPPLEPGPQGLRLAQEQIVFPSKLSQSSSGSLNINCYEPIWWDICLQLPPTSRVLYPWDFQFPANQPFEVGAALL